MSRQFLSVAMCTYNGAKYLREQLNSIVNQTRLPDEMIIYDDDSSDDTVEILNDFKKEAPFPVKIYQNSSNCGPTKNFEKAISLCVGDIIALSDQDDVWMPHKLEKLENTLEKYPDAGYVFSNALVVNEKLNSSGNTIWDCILFTKNQRERFKQGYQLEILLKHNVVTGATMAFRAEARKWILPIPKEWVHDAWIALLLSAIGANGIFVEEPLIKYRQHRNLLIGAGKDTFYKLIQKSLSMNEETYTKETIKLFLLINRLTTIKMDNGRAQEIIKAKILFLKTRMSLYSKRNLKHIRTAYHELLTGSYHTFSNGWKSFTKDLFVIIIKKIFKIK